METVSFTRMDQGTKEDYLLTGSLYRQADAHVADQALGLLISMAGPTYGYQVDRYQHSLQAASRAHRDGADEETIVCALLHDVGDVLAPHNHSQVAAAILRPFVSERNHWIILHHGIFQGYYFWHHIGGDRDAREHFRGHPYFDACADFCEYWDQRAFDPAYDTMPLETFEPMVRRLFAKSTDDCDNG
ncbi:MAG: HD domain-containing protein [Gammaproteobacteria bacterium]